jgi:spermidine synthase
MPIKMENVQAVASEREINGFDQTSSVPPLRPAIAILLMSASNLLLELSLTRLFSVILFYHFAFLAISVALLGLGAGGVFSYVLQKRLSRLGTEILASACALFGSLSIVVTLLLVIRIPVSLQLSAANFANLTVIYLASAVPFFFSGLTFSAVFARNPRAIEKLYAADLIGGSLACLCVVPALNLVGAPNAILLAALLMGVSSFLWVVNAKQKRWSVIACLGVAVLLVLNIAGNFIDVIYEKGKDTRLRQVEFARWNALSRIEVDRRGSERYVVIDADAATPINDKDVYALRAGGLPPVEVGRVPSVVNALRPNGRYAIIGPGGGPDIFRALVAGSPDVTGIEINPLIANDVMREKYSEFSKHIYTLPEVHINVADGRSWIRGSQQQFDVIEMTLVDTWAATAAGALALSENNLYTVNAFREYFTHLRPDGMIAVTRWEFRQPREALRVVSVAMQALESLGVSNVASHFIVVSEGPLNVDGVQVAVLAKKSPFTSGEIQTVQQQIAAAPSLVPLYLPGTGGSNPFADLITSNDAHSFARNYRFNVAPVDDNAPFFFFTLKLKDMFGRGGLRSFADWKVNIGVVVLGMLLVISLAAVACFLILPLALTHSRTVAISSLTYFVALGLAYMLVEITFIQRLVLFLGHPTYAITVVVFLMLLASGLGSYTSSRKFGENNRYLFVTLAAIVAILILYLLVLPFILENLVALSMGMKLAVSGIVLFPLAFLMGMPFPTGLKLLRHRDVIESNIEWAWALNAGASVLGSVSAMVIAMQFGLTAVLAVGAGCYLAAILLARNLLPRRA